MKILCFIDSIGSGGAQRQLVELAKEFKNKGNKVEFLVYHHEPFFLPELESNDIPYHYIQTTNYISRVIKLRKFIRSGKFDTVISFLEGASFIAEISIFPYKKWKLIVGERSANPKILKSCKLRFYRMFHLFADYIVANSNENLNLIKKVNPILSTSKMKVIYNILDVNKWKSTVHYTPYEGGKLNLIVVASHQFHKNGKNLVKSINLLSDSQKEKLKVDWYGEKNHDNSFLELQELIKSYNLETIFTFHDATNNIVDKIKKADILGLFSLYEGLPNVVCEAMILGKPIIASNVSDIPLLIGNKHLNLFDPNNCEEIKTVIQYYLNFDEILLNKLGDLNKQKALKLFNKEEITSKYINLMN